MRMEKMQRSTIGGICAISIGIIFIILAIAYFFVPSEQSATTTFFSPAYFTSINESFFIQEILYWGLTFSAILGIGVVAVITDRLRDINRDLTLWTSILAYIGFGIQILCNILGRDYVLRIAPYYKSLDHTVQAAINFQGNLYNDWAAFGLTGSWLIAYLADCVVFVNPAQRISDEPENKPPRYCWNEPVNLNFCEGTGV